MTILIHYIVYINHRYFQITNSSGRNFAAPAVALMENMNYLLCGGVFKLSFVKSTKNLSKILHMYDKCKLLHMYDRFIIIIFLELQIVPHSSFYLFWESP